MKAPDYTPAHPGEILKELYIEPFGLTITEFSKHLQTQRHGLSEIVNGKRGISPEMALKLADVLGTTPELWTNLQAKYDLYKARQSYKPLQRYSA